MNHLYTRSCGNISIVPMSPEYSEMYRRLRNREENRHFFSRIQSYQKEIKVYGMKSISKIIIR